MIRAVCRQEHCVVTVWAVATFQLNLLNTVRLGDGHHCHLCTATCSQRQVSLGKRTVKTVGSN